MSLLRTFCRAALVGILLGSIPAWGQEATKPSQAKPADGKPTTEKTAIVNLNTASVAQLEMLPGVGRRTAERIIEYREKNGGFKKIEELMNVPGVGEKSFLRIRSLLTVTPPKADGATGLASSYSMMSEGRRPPSRYALGRKTFAWLAKRSLTRSLPSVSEVGGHVEPV